MTERVCLSVEVELADGRVPDRFRIFRAGANETTKGTFTFDSASAESVLSAHASRGLDLPIDYDHAMADPGASPRDRVAAGWFSPAVVDGELWASDVRWTPAAARALADREWRYMSPWFIASKDGDVRRVERLLNVALTNTPATNQLDPIVAHDEPEESRETMAETKPDSGMDAGELVALTGAAGIDDARAVILAWREKAARVDVAETRATEAEAALSTMKRQLTDEKAKSLIETALADRRLTPARREAAERIYATAGLDVLEATLSLLSPVIGGQRITAPESDAVELSEEDREIMRRHGISEAAMLKTKRDEAARKAG